MKGYFEWIIERYSKYDINIGRVINDVVNGMFGRA
jgi:hypothetical protein